MTGDLPTTPAEDDWKPQVYVAGGLVGVVVGLLAAYFYARASEESTPDQPVAHQDDGRAQTRRGAARAGPPDHRSGCGRRQKISHA